MQLPELVSGLRTYSRRQAAADVGAGVIVGVVAFPLAIAFAIASGLPPEYGLATAVVAGFLISALGGSAVQIGGPTGAFVVIVYDIAQTHGVEGLTLATLMAGGLLVVMGFARLGAAIKFIPFPVTTGFTAGIAVIIALNELRDALGLSMDEVPGEFLPKLAAYRDALPTLSVEAVLLTLATLALLILWPRISRRVPAPFVALVAGSLAARLLGLEVETIGSRFGEVQFGLPTLRAPAFEPQTLGALVGPAFAIALLAGVESLLSAVVADGMLGTRHRSNVELVAQGVANIASPLFGGMPATGAIARTATNISSGGRTPVAGMVHALTLLAIGLFLGRWAAHIPMAVLAAILLLVAYHMSDWRTFAAELRGPRSDVLVLLTTFALTVAVDLTVAIQVGMVLAAFLFMRRMAEVTNVRALTQELQDRAGDDVAAGLVLPDDVQVYRIDGPFFFGAAEKFKETVATISSPPRVLILEMSGVPAMDSTGLHALRHLVRRSRGDGTTVLIAGLHAQPLTALARSGLLDELGEDALVGTVAHAVDRAAAA